LSKRTARWLWVLAWACIGVTGRLAVASEPAGTLRDADRSRLQGMLVDVAREIRANYFDPAFQGKDPEYMAATARRRIDAAHSTGEAMAAIAQFTLDFDDSHTYFIPPFQNVDVDYGWDAGIVGDQAVVLTVDDGSDAQGQGVPPGIRSGRSTAWR